MPGIKNNLYPPIVNTWMPAFVRDMECRVYFSLSSYNSASEIKNVQVIVNNQNTNLSALAPGLYPAGIKITDLQMDGNISGDDKYFITIKPEDLQSGIFELNQFYKVQLRFTGAEAENLTDMGKIAAWLVNNQVYFSEWSTVCLIKGIQKPEIYLKDFEDINQEQDVIFTTEVVDFIGSMYYNENSEIEKEYLKHYNIKIYKQTNDDLVYDSKEIYTNIYNPNEINYTLKTNLEDGVGYKVVLTYTTVNEYTSSVTYLFSVVQNAIDTLNSIITATIEEELGRAKISLVATVSELFFGNITIRRSSSESNFTIWEDIHEATIMNSVLNYTWYDYTIESGVWYKYCAQKRNSKGDRGTIINIRFPIMAVFDDMFLTRAGMQVRLRYNPTVSSFKKTMLESKTDTLGSKYPIIRRNGNVGYRQFPISGLITAFCDEEDIFINKENVYGESLSYYNTYNKENDITEYQDFIYEREFREQVMDFLHENTAKLFRSTTEGNILVKLMDISFTPNQTLGRMLYTFNATAYEIDECSLKNFNNYGIQQIGEYSTFLQYTFKKIGQMQGSYEGMKEDVLKLLQEDYSNRITEKYLNEVKCLRWLRLEFNMPPYLIKTAANGTPMQLPADETPDEDTILGYIAYINNKPVIVSQRGTYELLDEDTEITSLYFPVKSDVTIDFSVEVNQDENTTLLYDKIYYYTKVGQMRDKFDVNANAFLQIYQKYLLNYTMYHQQLLALDKVTVEAVPGTILYVKDSYDEDYFKHEIGPTGVLEFYDDEAVITGLKFGGVQLYPIDSKKEESRDYEFIETKISALNFNEIFNPIKNGVYKINNKRYVYYREEWFELSDDNIVQCPVYALIDYIYEYMKGEYKK